MKNTPREFKDLNIIDNYLINKIASDETIAKPFCKILLSSLLGKEFEIISVKAESIIPGITNKHKGIRMDIEVEASSIDEYSDNNNTSQKVSIYDIEPHLLGNHSIQFEKRNMLKHNRYYQARIDSKLLKRGETDFTKLKDVYIVTITDFDLFGEDYMQYTVHNKCDELPDMPYEDGLTFLYFYTNGSKGGSQALKNVLKYIEESNKNNVKDSSTEQLHNIVSTVKSDDEWGENYMEWEGYVRLRAEEYAEEYAKDIQKEADEQRARADAEKHRADNAENRANNAENRANSAENRANNAEAEIARLKEELAKLKQQAN